MRLVKLGDYWVNPDRVFAVEEGCGPAKTYVLASGDDGDHVLVKMPIADVVAALTQPETAPAADRAWRRAHRADPPHARGRREVGTGRRRARHPRDQRRQLRAAPLPGCVRAEESAPAASRRAGRAERKAGAHSGDAPPRLVVAAHRRRSRHFGLGGVELRRAV